MNTRPRTSPLPLFLPSLLALLLSGCTASNSPSTTPTVTPATVTTVAPATVAAGSLATPITITGTNFLASSVVQIAGVSEQTTFVSSTQLQATIPSSMLSIASMLPVAVLNGSTTSSSGPAVTIEVDNPAPVISSFSPTALMTGSTSSPLLIAGTGIVPTSGVQINGSPRPTTYVSPSQLSVAVTAADVAASGTASVTIVNPAPGGGTSAAASVPINNPLPTGITLTPTSVIAGVTPTSTITVNGAGFIAASVANVNGVAHPTKVVSPTQLTFALTTTEQANATTLAITVTNPAPGGGTSTPASLAVNLPTPTPVLQSLSPAQFILGSPDSLLLVSGLNFTNKSVVQWNGNPLATSYSASTRLYATVPGTLLGAVGSANITVSAPTATPSTSNALPLTIVPPPAPTINSVSPNYGPIGVDAKLTIYGTGFTASSTVSFNGTALATTYSNTGMLTAVIPAASIALPGNGSITVTTPAPGGGTTAAVPFTAYIPIVSNSMVYNPANGLLYLSIPSSAGAPYGNSVVSVDPSTGAFGTPIHVGSEPNKLALSSDGTILWVGLDGGSGVRQVNLTTNTAGLSFSLGSSTSLANTNPPTAYALAALPGAPNSVVVAAPSASYYYGTAIVIYDNGVIRGTPASYSNYTSANALQIDGTKNEVYVAGSGGYSVYSYNASGVTLKTSVTTGNYASYYSDDLQLAAGRIYTDFGTVDDVESGSLLGTFYTSGTIPATGPVYADTTLNRAFILDSPVQYSYSYTQIQTFNTTDFNPSSTSVIPVNGVSTNSSGVGSYPSHLTRWGTNGVAFRASNGIFSFRSNLVKDLSTTTADLGVSITASGANTTGSNTTYTLTVSNAGPSGATNIALTSLLPASGVLLSATPAQGKCSTAATVICNLGSLANGASTTVTIVIQQTNPGSSVLTAQVTGAENDSSLSNNQATSTTTITGSIYNPTPAITSISPAAAQAGANDTVITVNGSGFNSNTVALWNGTALTTSVVSTSQLTATIPAANLTTLGWGAITVSSPAPGGGTSAASPFSIFNVITLGVNHILYDPFSRKIYASVGSGSSTVNGNSIATITPETGIIGTPVNIGSQPMKMAFSDDGQVLYTVLNGSNSVARFNMLTQQADYTYTPDPSTYSAGNGFGDIDVLPGTENTIALNLNTSGSIGLYDFNPATKTAALRSPIGFYGGTSLRFLNSTSLLTVANYTSYSLTLFPVTAAGLQYTNGQGSILKDFGPFKLNGGIAFSNYGGAADPSTYPATQLGVYPANSSGYCCSSQIVAPDTSLSRVFFLGYTGTSTYYSSNPDGIIAYDQKTYLPTAIAPLNMPAIEGTNTSYTGVDLIRWGQDGLAALTSGGHIYIMRGPVVVPQLLNQNSAATLTAATPANIAHGTGNTILTITGSGFIQGAAVTWNGSYRTTTWVDSSHLTIAVPASDLTTAGSATLVVTNPGASASGSISFTIN